MSSPPAVTPSSREIAELAGKRHADVMRDIHLMMEVLQQNAELRSVCISGTYVGENEHRYPSTSWTRKAACPYCRAMTSWPA